MFEKCVHMKVNLSAIEDHSKVELVSKARLSQLFHLVKAHVLIHNSL